MSCIVLTLHVFIFAKVNQCPAVTAYICMFKVMVNQSTKYAHSCFYTGSLIKISPNFPTHKSVVTNLPCLPIWQPRYNFGKYARTTDS